MALAALAVSASALLATPAHAHISMVGALKSRDTVVETGKDPQKSFPCDGKKGDGPTYTFEPGATIKLEISEDIPHPSYFRIAFDNDGDDNFVSPKSIKPIEADRKCPFDGADKCGDSDFCNVTSATGGAAVLWDNLDSHPASAAFGKKWAWNVKLPNVECANCTIQVIQVMEDVAHGAYCPPDSCTDPKDSFEDIYHRCIDIKLVKGATSSAGTTKDAVSNKGEQCAAKDSPPIASNDAGVPASSDAGSPTADAGVTVKDAGSSKPTAKDAGSSKPGTAPPGEGTDDDDSDDDSTAVGSTKDAGKGTKRDAGKASSSDDEVTTPAKVDDGGCSVAPSNTGSSGAAWSLLALSALLARRKRSRSI
jgi:MYXO-CTERM domain-containing protein